MLYGPTDWIVKEYDQVIQTPGIETFFLTGKSSAFSPSMPSDCDFN